MSFLWSILWLAGVYTCIFRKVMTGAPDADANTTPYYYAEFQDSLDLVDAMSDIQANSPEQSRDVSLCT